MSCPGAQVRMDICIGLLWLWHQKLQNIRKVSMVLRFITQIYAILVIFSDVRHEIFLYKLLHLLLHQIILLWNLSKSISRIFQNISFISLKLWMHCTKNGMKKSMLFPARILTIYICITSYTLWPWPNFYSLKKVPK